MKGLRDIFSRVDGVVVVYGEKGVGKTFFVLQFLKTYASDNVFAIYISDPHQIKMPHKSILDQLNTKKIFVESLMEFVREVRDVIKKYALSRAKKAIFVFDVNNIMMNLGIREVEIFRRLVFIMKTISEIGRWMKCKIVFLLVLYENLPEGHPYYWNILLRFRTNFFIRIERVTRIRRISLYSYDYVANNEELLIETKAMLTQLGFSVPKEFSSSQDAP